MTKVLNRQQARWAQELASINFRIYYRPGTQNGKPDALSRCSEYRPEKGGVENQPITSVLGKNHFKERLLHSFICSLARLASLPARKWSEEFLVEVRKEGEKDEAYKKAKKEAVSVELVPKNRKVKDTPELREGLFYWKNRLWAPEGMVQKILESEHNTKVAGHMGQDKTIELV